MNAFSVSFSGIEGWVLPHVPEWADRPVGSRLESGWEKTIFHSEPITPPAANPCA